MFDFEVGVSTESTYVVKRIDNDFFEDDDIAMSESETSVT
jgi:hypothetical protein